MIEEDDTVTVLGTASRMIIEALEDFCTTNLDDDVAVTLHKALLRKMATSMVSFSKMCSQEDLVHHLGLVFIHN